VARREAAWMRPEISRIMQGVSVTSLPRACSNGFEARIAKPRVARRGGDGIAAELRMRPCINDYIVDGASMFIVNFATKENMLILAEHGLGSVPCGNPACRGKDGKWHTHPVRWDSKTSALSILLREDGLPAPMIAACSACETCTVVSSHLNPILLRRLGDVPELLDKLPFDPEWPFGETYIHRNLTSGFEYDSVKRQGVDNMLEKLTKLASEAVQRRCLQYVVHGQVWLRQLAGLVGDEADGREGDARSLPRWPPRVQAL